MDELNVVLLEERTRDGWAGRAELPCPCCGTRTVYRVITNGAGRSVGLWVDQGPHQVERQTFTPSPHRAG